MPRAAPAARRVWQKLHDDSLADDSVEWDDTAVRLMA